jgi:hypothetical protein
VLLTTEGDWVTVMRKIAAAASVLCGFVALGDPILPSSPRQGHAQEEKGRKKEM